MPFRKAARAVIVGSLDDGQLRRRAQVGGGESAYGGGVPSTIDFQQALLLVADAYDVSKTPSDYIFVVARAVTAELSPDRPAPNENGDAFPLEELLRFDHRLARRVYKTFDLKPNHINHRADNPKTARGFIVDSTFNRTNPDDQYVECLIAIDGSKDPVYADGIRTGAIDSFSMGCVAEYTICSVCANKATNRWQFCRHIANHKMKEFDGILAYERCGGVCYEELSAVDQPADPKALTQEVLSLQAKIAESEQLGAESELLVLKSRLAKVEQQLAEALAHVKETTMTNRTAQQAPAPAQIPPPPKAAQPMGPPMEEEAPIMAQEAPPAAPPAAGMMPFAGEGDMPIAEDDGLLEPAPMPAPAAGPPDAMEQYKDKRDLEDQAPMSDADMGIMSVAARRLSRRYASRYANIAVAATKQGNFRVYDERTGRTLFAVRAPGRLANRKQAVQFCDVLIRHIAHYGLDQAMRRFRAIPKRSQVLEHHDDNLTDAVDGQAPVLEGNEDNLTDALGKPATDSARDRATDQQETSGKGPASVIDDRVSNAADIDDVSADSLDSLGDHDSDRRDEPADRGIGDEMLADEVHDHSERVARIQTYFQRKIAAQQKEWEGKLAAIEGRVEKLATKKAQDMMARFERCLKLASERQRLNREESPLKAAMADALLTPFDINANESWPGCETDLTAMLVERGMQEGMPDHLASLIARAKQLYTLDDRVITDSERDLRHALAAPTVTVVPSGERVRSARSMEMESRALGGNPVLKTSARTVEAREEKRIAIRESVGRPGFVRMREAAKALGSIGKGPTNS